MISSTYALINDDNGQINFRFFNKDKMLNARPIQVYSFFVKILLSAIVNPYFGIIVAGLGAGALFIGVYFGFCIGLPMIALVYFDFRYKPAMSISNPKKITSEVDSTHSLKSRIVKQGEISLKAVLKQQNRGNGIINQ